MTSEFTEGRVHGLQSLARLSHGYDMKSISSVKMFEFIDADV